MNVSPYLYNNRVKILKGLISYVRCVGFNLEAWGTTKGFLSVSWRDQSCPQRVALDTAESGLERGKSGKQTSREGLQPLCWEMVARIKRTATEKEASTWINKTWCLDLKGKRFYCLPSLLPSICLLKIHEMSLVLPTHHSIPNSQTLSLAPTSPVTFRSKITTVTVELHMDSNLTLHRTQIKPMKNQNPKKITSISLFLMQVVTFFLVAQVTNLGVIIHLWRLSTLLILLLNNCHS